MHRHVPAHLRMPPLQDSDSDSEDSDSDPTTPVPARRIFSSRTDASLEQSFIRQCSVRARPDSDSSASTGSFHSADNSDILTGSHHSAQDESDSSNNANANAYNRITFASGHFTHIVQSRCDTASDSASTGSCHSAIDNADSGDNNVSNRNERRGRDISDSSVRAQNSADSNMPVDYPVQGHDSEERELPISLTEHPRSRTSSGGDESETSTVHPNSTPSSSTADTTPTMSSPEESADENTESDSDTTIETEIRNPQLGSELEIAMHRVTEVIERHETLHGELDLDTSGVELDDTALSVEQKRYKLDLVGNYGSEKKLKIEERDGNLEFGLELNLDLVPGILASLSEFAETYPRDENDNIIITETKGQPKESLMKCNSFRIGSTLYYVDLRENMRGLFRQIAKVELVPEMTRWGIIIPLSGLPRFVSSVQEVIASR